MTLDPVFIVMERAHPAVNEPAGQQLRPSGFSVREAIMTAPAESFANGAGEGIPPECGGCSAAERLRDQVTHLGHALSSARQIGMAMGVLMGTLKCGPEQAFALLRSTSQTSNRKLRDVADDVILTGALPDTGRRAGTSVTPQRHS